MGVLDNIENNPSINSEIDKAIIGNAVPKGQEVDPYSQALLDNFEAENVAAPIGNQGASLYPGRGHNINVGTYSGSIVGSNPIFVPGGNIASINPLLARQKALDDAAKKRAAALKPFDYGDPMKLKDARFQKSFNDAYYNAANKIVDDAYSKYGKRASIVLEDPNTPEGRRMRQGLANFEYLGKNMDQITDKMAEIQKNLESGDLEYSDEAMKIYRENKHLLGNFENGDVFSAQDLQTKYEEMEGVIGLENYIQKPGFLKGIMGEKSGYTYDTDKGEFYKYGTSHKVDYKEALSQVAESLAKGPFRTAIVRGIITKDKILETLNSRFKTQVTKTGNLTKKNKENIAGDSVSEKGIFLDKDKPGKTNIFDYDDDGDLLPTKTEFKSYYEHDVNTTELGKNRTIKVDGINAINNGEENVLEGVNELQLSGIATVKYKDANGVERTKVVARAKINSPVKRVYDEAGNPISIKDYRKMSKEEQGLYRVREETQVIDKMIDLDDHTYDQIRNQISEKDRKNLDKARANAFKTKRELIEQKSNTRNSSTPKSKGQTQNEVFPTNTPKQVDEYGVPLN